MIETPIENSDVKHAYHLYTILINFKKLGKSRNEIMKVLKKNNIGTQVLYIPVHLQPYYLKKYGFTHAELIIVKMMLLIKHLLNLILH